MKIFECIKEIESQSGLAVAVGAFDGFHIAHQEVIGNAVKNKKRLKSAVFTFDRETVGRICSPSKKRALLAELGVDILVSPPFCEFSHMTPEEFVRDILHGKMSAKLVSCGYNFHFGAGASGDASLLGSLCEKYGIEVIVSEKIEKNGEIVSSTAIRSLVSEGNVIAAKSLLGRAFSIGGKVQKGRGIGQQYGCRTANIIPPDGVLLPKFGVYKSRILIGKTLYDGVTNIGVNPTVGGEKAICESHIFGIEGDLYGEYAEVFFDQFIREERKFASKEELFARIREDISMARGCQLTIEN